MKPRVPQGRLTDALRTVRRRAARPTWAVVELHVGTPINTNSEDPLDLAGHFRWDGRLGPRRAAAIEALIAAGWAMDRPAVRLDEPRRLLDDLQRAQVAEGDDQRVIGPLHCDGFLDFDIRFRKRYRDAQLAEHEVRELELTDGSDNWDLGWDEQPDGDVAWWCAVVDLIP
jgi:hypothetical protein